MTSLPFSYLMNGQLGQALNWAMSDYIGYGMLWIFFGMLIFGAVWVRTKSYGIAGIVFMLYTALVSVALPLEMSIYLMLIIGIMVAIMLIKLVMK